MDHQTIQRSSCLIILAVWLFLVTPVAAQGPIGASATDGSGSVYDTVVAAVAPIVDFLDDYAALAASPATITEDVWGAQLLSTGDTGEGPGTGSPPPEYYPDAPEQVREAGYTLEGLTTADISAMSALDFARWLGFTMALPFEFARGVQDIAAIIGPIGLFLSWLFMAALWVGIIYFISFLISFIKTLLEVGGKVLQAIELFRP